MKCFVPIRATRAILICCAHHIVTYANIRKTDTHRLQILISWIVEAGLWPGERWCARSDLPQSYQSSRAGATLVMTDTWPLGTESGFPKFPKIKYLGGDSVSGKTVHGWHFFSKNLFSQNDLPDLDSLVQT